MAKTFSEAKQNVDEMYKSLTQIADDIVKKNTEKADKIIKDIENNVEKLTNEELRNYTLKLASLAYSLGDLVEHADLKRECANALMKETNAREFSIAAGTVDTKKSTALLNTSQEQAVALLYDLIANSLKSKLVQTQRVIDSLKNTLISRNAEAKLNANIKNIGFDDDDKF